MELNPETTFNVADIPITHAILASSLSDYARVNDKIAYMVEKGELTKVQRGLYVFTNSKNKNNYINYNIANIIYGPSYVSRFSALSYYGLLSEHTVAIESMALSRYREYHTSVGNFTYFHSARDTFSIGISSFNKDQYTSFLMATPEKALCDLIWSEKSLPIRSLDDIVFYLEEDLRLDMSFFKEADTSIFTQCQMMGNKKNEIGLLLKLK